MKCPWSWQGASRDSNRRSGTEIRRPAVRRFGERPAARHPDDLKTLADLAKFPLSTKDDLREN
ncbi:hypothetical protein A33K_16401 [Burkholderia humptydooensis MSMB43]|uniref:Uncharacterized protein n=1 Tax=Burkholderia humptydooensis MSMB43 TaxID=441157 RepID=A0ABN0G3X2_9BURK|nr:hypothetical protein A33K_16401 [Burkholderia humptydooensis MSMB43]